MLNSYLIIYQVEYLSVDEIEILDVDDYNDDNEVADQILNDRPALYLVD